MIAEAKTRYALPIRTLAAQMRLSAASLLRWKRRLRRGEVAVGKRGPRKVRPLNFNELTERIRGLEHGKKRSRGSGPLHRAYNGGISRRELNAMVRQVCYETNRVRCVETHHVTWLRANLAWAMDDCRKTKQAADGSLYLHNLTDLCTPGTGCRRWLLTACPAGRRWPGTCSTCLTASSRHCSANATTAAT